MGYDVWFVKKLKRCCVWFGIYKKLFVIYNPEWFNPITVLHVWQGSEYAPGLLKWDIRKYLLYIKLTIVFTQNLEFFSYSEIIQYIEVQHSSEKSMTKIKEKW